tara:strand:- start:556 stop:933 length:378 start_codon:yes stop_codon:yes gene_type:complete
MKTVHFNAYFDHMIDKIKETRDAGQKEYAHDEENVFANFDRVSKSLKITSEQALMVYLLKHIDGINAYIKGHDSQREEVSGRITDAITYLLLLWAMIDGKKDLKSVKKIQSATSPGGVFKVESML